MKPETSNQAFSAEYRNISAVGNEEMWLTDIAASTDMTLHKKWFSELKPIMSET